jgi:protein-tyrosine kinase
MDRLVVMSLIERALEKLLQERRAAAAAAPADVATERLPNAVRNALIAPGPSARPAPARLPAASKKVRINRETLLREGLLPPEQDERLLAHQFMHIKRPLVENAFGRGSSSARKPAGNLIMICSALPGDGKTFTTMNLTLSFVRETDAAVLLIDGDVSKAHISRALGVEREPGLMDALRDGNDIDSMILATDIEGLNILPAGSGSDRATEFLTSERMHTLLGRLCGARSDRIILLDSPPLLLTNEAPAIARIAGQLVLVVRAGMTPKQAVLDAVALLEEEKFIGLVFNQSQGRIDSYGYYGSGDRRNDSGMGDRSGYSDSRALGSRGLW